jgi:hypothetical protein
MDFKGEENMPTEEAVRLSREDIDKLGKISDLLIRIFEKEKKLFDNELLNSFYGKILVMTDEMDGTGMIAVKYIKPMKDFI